MSGRHPKRSVGPHTFPAVLLQQCQVVANKLSHGGIRLVDIYTHVHRTAYGTRPNLNRESYANTHRIHYQEIKKVYVCACNVI